MWVRNLHLGRLHIALVHNPQWFELIEEARKWARKPIVMRRFSFDRVDDLGWFFTLLLPHHLFVDIDWAK